MRKLLSINHEQPIMHEILPEHLRAFVDEQINSGRYATTSEMIVHGLAVLREREMLRQAKLADLRREIQKGHQDSEEGCVAPWDPEQIKRRGREILQQFAS